MTDEPHETRRMLEWFKAQLPAHELDNWQIQAQPLPRPIQVEGKLLYANFLPNGTQFRIEGWAYCVRCGKQFRIPSIGNALTIDESSITSTAEKMKKWVARDAERDGPCWGDVPEIPDYEFAAVPDSQT